MRRRQDRRLGVQLPGSYQHAGSSSRHAFISQLSANGCRLDADEMPLEIGDVLELSLGAVETLSASVKWKTGTTIGVEFENALDDIVVQFFAAYCSNVA